MADISQIKVVDEVFDIKDASARADIAEILKYKSMTKEQMLAVVDDDMPDVCSTLCSDDNCFYIYNKTNEANDETGKFELYTELNIDNLSNTPYVFVKPSEIILTSHVPETLNNSYSLDNIGPSVPSSYEPTLIIKNDYEETSFTMGSVYLGGTFDVMTGYYTQPYEVINFTTSTRIDTFGELNSNNIRKITLKSSSWGDPISTEDGAIKFCTHLPYLTDYVDDDSVTTEGYILRRDGTSDYEFIYVDLYISGDRAYCATESDFGTQLKTWNTNGQTFQVVYKKTTTSAGSQSARYEEPSQFYFNGNCTLHTDVDSITAEITESSTETVNNILYTLNASVTQLLSSVKTIESTMVSSDGSILRDANIAGVFNMGRFMSNNNTNAFTELKSAFQTIMTTGSVDTTLLLKGLQDTLRNGGAYSAMATNTNGRASELFNSSTDLYYANIIRISVPLTIEDPTSPSSSTFNTIVDIERIPSTVQYPNSNGDTRNQEEYTHKFRTIWTDCDGDLNIFNFIITSTYTPINEWVGNRTFTFTADGDIQKVPKYQSAQTTAVSTNGIPTIEYACENPEYHEQLFGMEDITTIRYILDEYSRNGRLIDDLKSSTGMSTLAEVIQNVKEFEIDILFTSEVENGEFDVDGNPLTDIDNQRLSLMFKRDNMNSWVSGNPYMPSSSINGIYSSLTSVTYPGKLANIMFSFECYAENTSLENCDENVGSIQVIQLF